MINALRLIKVATGIALSVQRLASGCTVQGSDSVGVEILPNVQPGPETTKLRVQWIPAGNKMAGAWC
jgi:hypothetical protein